ncbi:MAG: response regulator transcription factor [Desulfobulbaceae bacterium]|nr:response regulator transcription factor [Desulfobulbaceae bacterium]
MNSLPSGQRTKRILIVEDHAILRDGLRAILADYSEFKVVSEAADGLEGIRRASELQPDLVLLDMTMPKMNGIDALVEMKKVCPRTRVLILSVHSSQSYCKAAIRAGADGYILKDSRQEELIEAIQKTLKGERFISRELRGTHTDNNKKKKDSEEAITLKSDLLTRREKQILKLIAEGYSNKEIGEMLFISPKTVDNHRTNLMRKLNLHNVQELTRYASRENLLVDEV